MTDPTNQPADPTPGYSAAPAAPAAPYGSPAGAVDPGKTLGIVGLVLAFLVAPVGLIISIIARVKSKAAGFKNGLATAGIIVSIVVMVLYILFGVLIGIGVAAAISEACAGFDSGTYETTDGTTITCP